MRLVEFDQWDFSEQFLGEISGKTAINPEYVVRVSTWSKAADQMRLEYCDGRTVYSVVVKGTWREVMAKLRGDWIIPAPAERNT